MSSVVLVTGLSGAGGSQAANVFEDMGWFVIDNLPTELLDKVIDLVNAKSASAGGPIEKVALVIRTKGLGEDLSGAIQTLRNTVDDVRVLFLDAADDVLVRRYEDNRRRHPHGAGGVEESIKSERKALEPLKAEADLVIDTSDLNVHQLRDRITEQF